MNALPSDACRKVVSASVNCFSSVAFCVSVNAGLDNICFNLVTSLNALVR